ncbi:hypothetical protein VPIG_00054 [Vibrio phage PWH3a-P1]|uniref:hypothetical protein n=1 Tax=Vibrio phage PWH3a-P1 TaxID=754058 RepID=UPI0002C14172|nr:hypothetical protein VPIG_00054 [Vibrio phage PWH3a-P1]AGH31912.1 hypothetical protein VPIG_00054 [Vibrio phage PWH3a-P1]
MQIKKIELLTEEEADNIVGYKKGRVSEFFLKEYKYSTTVKQTENQKGGIYGIVFKCQCKQLFHMSISKLSYQKINSDVLTINCGCIYEKEEKIKIEKAKATYFNKLPKSKDNPSWCTYCESYRPEVKQKSKNTYNCENCDFLIGKRVVLGETFEEIMARWEPTTHKSDTKKLPYLEGNNKKGYKVRGFTYVSTDWYDEVSKWLWIKVKDYIKTSFSKENLMRVGKEDLYKPVKNRKYDCFFLHRFVLGLGNDVNMVGDHVNGYKMDNRNDNLRYITAYQNRLNSKKSNSKSVSKYKGVSFYTKRFKRGNACWKAELNIKDRQKTRYFYTEEEAAKCYDDMLRENLPNEVHRFNFPQEGEMSAI